ncbi:alpha/beta hydrolase [Paraburkholderia dipogonis]|uniref:Alpha/beta hydrolase n=1 Tax=Paraburkholderia dipogonis TaxID=1211383 RepID=A0A4Y8N5K9_9BURK|nr:alpha/beta hydrolase [Paraburkholderia dipogonis]TFE44698.1 alpha/beta hydrolase [Paraburkholderia dipogonis]
MNTLLKKCLAATLMLGGLVSQAAFTPASAAAPNDGLKGKNVVLVHGAFADGSGWNKVIPLLEAKGLHVVAVQNSLKSLDDDAAATQRVIEQQNGPVVLVGHSWGGAVISQAGNSDKVKALVYVAAFAPDNGQSINDLFKGKPAPAWMAALQKDSAGYLTLSTDAIMKDFAQDLPPAEARVVAATQGPWFAGCADDKLATAAWHSKPSWYVLAQKDRMIPPPLQAAMAQQIGATVVKVNTSHVAMMSQPTEVAAAIITAARAAK